MSGRGGYEEKRRTWCDARWRTQLTVRREGRSAVVSISSPRLWMVLVSFDSSLRSQRPPPPSARDTIENGKSEKIAKSG